MTIVVYRGHKARLSLKESENKVSLKPVLRTAGSVATSVTNLRNSVKPSLINSVFLTCLVVVFLYIFSRSSESKHETKCFYMSFALYF